MANGKSSKFVTSSMPKTAWREPPRARDDLLRLPKGGPLRPTNEVHQPMHVEAALDAGVLPGEASTSLAEEQAISASSGTDSRTEMSQLDGCSQRSEASDSDAEEGVEAEEQDYIASPTTEEDAASEPETGDELEDDELLAGEERNSDEEGLSTPAPAGPRPVPAGKHRAKDLRGATETVRPHPTDATKVIVTYRYTMPIGGVYVQETELPQVVSESTNGQTDTGGVIFPDVETSKVPRKRKDSPWTPVPGPAQFEWTRGQGKDTETWRINIFFRRLHPHTHAYQDIYVNTTLLDTVDPNDKRFRTSYNKWVLQFARRRDASYMQKVVRVHWSTAERRALYTAINAFCARHGVHALGFTNTCKLSTAALQRMADAVNAVPNAQRLAPRGVDAVRGQIVSAHDKRCPKNKAVFELMGRAAALRARIAGGEVVGRAERKPRAAIPLADFPIEPPAPLAGRKRKRAAGVGWSDEEPSSSELSSPRSC